MVDCVLLLNHNIPRGKESDKKNQAISKNSIRSASKDKIWNNWNNCQNITKSDNINDYVTICDNIWQRGQYLKMTQYLPIYDNIW